MGEGRFCFPKTIEDEELCVERAVPKSTRYKNKWEVGIFEDWQRVRSVKFPIVEIGGVFKEYEFDKVQPLTRPITEIDALTLNYWLSKFCSRGGKVVQRSIPSENVVPDCLRHSPIHGGKELSHRVQSLGLFRQKVRELALLERGAI